MDTVRRFPGHLADDRMIPQSIQDVQTYTDSTYVGTYRMTNRAFIGLVGNPMWMYSMEHVGNGYVGIKRRNYVYLPFEHNGPKPNDPPAAYRLSLDTKFDICIFKRNKELNGMIEHRKFPGKQLIGHDPITRDMIQRCVDAGAGVYIGSWRMTNNQYHRLINVPGQRRRMCSFTAGFMADVRQKYTYIPFGVEGSDPKFKHYTDVVIFKHVCLVEEA